VGRRYGGGLRPSSLPPLRSLTAVRAFAPTSLAFTGERSTMPCAGRTKWHPAL